MKPTPAGKTDSPGRILIVDDEPMICQSCREVLESEGYLVESAGGGEEGLRAFLEREFDLVLLDMKMPDLCGLEVLKRMKAGKPRVPVVMITAYSTVESAVEAMKAGAVEFVQKPFTPEELSQAVRSVFRQTAGKIPREEAAPPRKAEPVSGEFSPEAQAPRTADPKEIIRQSELFWNLSEEQARKVAELAVERSFAAGERIFTAGELLPHFYIVGRGKVSLEMEIRIGSRTKRTLFIDMVGDGRFLGWSELLNLPAQLSATAVENSQMLAFDGAAFRGLCDADMELGYKAMQELVKLVSSRLSHARRTLAHVLSATSHDLRAPLATVQSAIDVILGGFAGETTSKQKDLLSGSRGRIIDLLKMIDNILDISYIEIRGADLEKVDLRRVAVQSIGDVEGLRQRKDLRVENRVQGALAPVLGVPKRLQQVLTNLLGNAVKFTAPGGRVTVFSKETADKVQIDVADTGVGIPAEELPKIFSDFYRGQGVDVEGAGLGLAIAKKIVEGHGGSIWVVSPDPETGKGTRFSFALPKVLEGPQAPQPSDRPGPGGADILVVDEDPEMLLSVSLLLESQGYRVRTAPGGSEALEKIGEKEPDLLILDPLTPRMEGFGFCKRLKEKGGAAGLNFPVIILSAVAEGAGRRRQMQETEAELRAEGHVPKPLSPVVLLQRVEKALRRPIAGAAGETMPKGERE